MSPGVRPLPPPFGVLISADTRISSSCMFSLVSSASRCPALDAGSVPLGPKEGESSVGAWTLVVVAAPDADGVADAALDTASRVSCRLST